MEKITGIFDGAKGGWNKIGKTKKVTMVTLLFGILLLISIYTFNSNKVNYVPLFKDLELKDAGNIVNDLDLKKMDYKLANNGRDILVDENIIDKYRLQLAMEGMMPENSSGFEIFDNIGLMVTEEDRKIMYQRALTGELQRSIMSIDGVNAAKVHLMMPVKSIFESEERQASASVIIDLKSSQKITSDTIKGIAALIAGAVDNLPDENIQIIDSKGNLLSSVLQKEGELNTMDVLGKYQEAQDIFQKKIETNLKNLLGSAFGIDKIMVSVYADLDFDSEESTMITYDNPVIRSEQVDSSGPNVQVSQNPAGNIDDNISNVVGVTVGEGSSYSKTTNNELSTETKTTIKAPGKVNRLTTSVIYDGNLTADSVERIHNIIATATGYDSERGDLINVEGLVFDRSYQEQLEKDLAEIGSEIIDEKDFLGKYSKYIVIGLLSLVGLFILIAVIKSASSKKSKVSSEFEGQVVGGVNVNNLIEDLNADIEVKQDTQKIKAQKYAKENPEIATDLIKAWLKD